MSELGFLILVLPVLYFAGVEEFTWGIAFLPLIITVIASLAKATLSALKKNNVK